jgi:hypothetical protein
MNKAALTYSMKVCLTAALLAPILYLFPYEHFHGDDSESGFIILWIVIVMGFGLVWSLLVSFLMALILNLILDYATSVVRVKSILSGVVTALSVAAVLVWFQLSTIKGDFFQIIAMYVISSVACVWIYKLQPLKEIPGQGNFS